MHELSIAMNIVEIVEEQFGKEDNSPISEMELDIGAASGVVIEALRFALEEAVKSSILDNTRIIINEIPAKSKCLSCAHEFVPEDIISPCPSCGYLYADVISGKEMLIRRIRYY